MHIRYVSVNLGPQGSSETPPKREPSRCYGGGTHIGANLSSQTLTNNALRCRRTVSVCTVLKRAKRDASPTCALKLALMRWPPCFNGFMIRMMSDRDGPNRASSGTADNATGYGALRFMVWPPKTTELSSEESRRMHSAPYSRYELPQSQS